MLRTMNAGGFSLNLALPDLWQQEAVRALRGGSDVVVDAPTGAGKTWIFELLVKGGWKGPGGVHGADAGAGERQAIGVAAAGMECGDCDG